MKAGSTALVAAALAVAASAQAADYWTYAYKDLDVLAEGTEAQAQVVGRRLAAMDEAMRSLLRLPGAASEPPTRVYALAPSELAGLDDVWSSQRGTFFRAAPFDDYLVLYNEGSAIEPAVTAERVRALLASWGLARLPDWYRHGVALLMSASRFDQDHITVGQEIEERTARLARDWIPMSQFLQLPASDPLLHRSPDAEATYDAQCWWLVHMALLDGVLDKVLPAYLQRLLIGESHEAAYAATFGMPYEQLDNYFRKLRHNFKLRQYTGTLPEASALGSLQRPSEPEVKARLAELLLVHQPASQAGAAMAEEALSADPKSERAMLAVARRELGARRYAKVQDGTQQLGALDDLSASGHRDLGILLATLARFKDEAMPGTDGIDSKSARAAARTHLQRALAIEPNDPRALYQLGWLVCGQGDVAGTRELVPQVEAAFYRRPESAEFAELLVRMYSIAGTPQDVFKYAVAEQRLAATESERVRAAARVERLRAQLKSAQ